MGGQLGKEWKEMGEVEDFERGRGVAEETGEQVEEAVKEKPRKKSFKEKLRSRILKVDPRSKSDGLDRTPISIDSESDASLSSSVAATPERPPSSSIAVLEDPRSPAVAGEVGGGVSRTPIVVPLAQKVEEEKEPEIFTPLRGSVTDTPEYKKPVATGPKELLADKLRAAVKAGQSQCSSIAPPAAEGGVHILYDSDSNIQVPEDSSHELSSEHNDSTLLI